MVKKRRILAKARLATKKVKNVDVIPIERLSAPYPLQKRTSLAKALPEIAAQWHYEKNCGWTPDEFSRGSGISAWWICDQGPDHVWRQRICIRGKGNGCPFCANQLVSVTNSLAACNPKLAAEWHPTKNKCKATQITAKSSQSGWWICAKKHVWFAVVNNRNGLDSGCPECLDEKRTTGLTSVAELLKYFDYRRNGNIDPFKLQVATKVWWRCEAAPDHNWYAGFWKDLAKQTCPFCRGTRASSTNNLTLDPVLKKDFKATLNPGINPREVPLGSAKLITWKCHRCRHVWTTRAAQRGRRGSGCRVCAAAARRGKNRIARGLFP